MGYIFKKKVSWKEEGRWQASDLTCQGGKISSNLLKSLSSDLVSNFRVEKMERQKMFIKCPCWNRTELTQVRRSRGRTHLGKKMDNSRYGRRWNLLVYKEGNKWLPEWDPLRFPKSGLQTSAKWDRTELTWEFKKKSTDFLPLRFSFSGSGVRLGKLSFSQRCWCFLMGSHWTESLIYPRVLGCHQNVGLTWGLGMNSIQMKEW